jgi:hypothetical protein
MGGYALAMHTPYNAMLLPKLMNATVALRAVAAISFNAAGQPPS